MTDYTADVRRIMRQLAVYRVLRGLNQRDIAALLGVYQSTVSGWEKGRTMPGGRYLTGYARAVGKRLAVVDEVEQTDGGEPQ